MQKKQLKTEKYYVRVYLSSPESDKYLTLGPFLKEKAAKMAQNYLSTGVCSWIEKVK